MTLLRQLDFNLFTSLLHIFILSAILPKLIEIFGSVNQFMNTLLISFNHILLLTHIGIFGIIVMFPSVY